MTETKTIQTQYGDVSIDTVECDSCGNTIAKRDAHRFAIHNGVPNPRFNDADRSGYACDYCASEGPISFPNRAKKRLKILAEDMDFVFGVLMWPLSSLIIIADADEGWQRGFAMASYGAWVWIIVILGVFRYILM